MKKLSVFHQFLNTVKRYRLIEENSRVLVGVSGGADSVALLDLVRIVAPRMRLEVFAVHINHQLRKTAVDDERFVWELARRWGIELVVVRVNVQAYARRNHLSIEEAARWLRYLHFRRLARRLKCERVALGHNADDNLETVLLNLTRGTGLRGLAGIPLRRGIFVRPLLEVRREAIRYYLKARGIEWVEDETNEDIQIPRNLIRKVVVPILGTINPGVRENVLRSSAIIGAEDLLLDFLGTRMVERLARRGNAGVVIDINEFNSYNNVLKRRMVKALLPKIDAEAVERLLFLTEKRLRGSHQLSGGVTVTIDKENLVLPIRRQELIDGD